MLFPEKERLAADQGTRTTGNHGVFADKPEWSWEYTGYGAKTGLVLGTIGALSFSIYYSVTEYVLPNVPIGPIDEFVLSMEILGYAAGIFLTAIILGALFGTVAEGIRHTASSFSNAAADTGEDNAAIQDAYQL